MNKMKRIIAILLLLGAARSAQAQTDTISIMQYNLLFYGSTGNATTTKNPWLSTIINYVQPDIFGANEIRSGTSYMQSIHDSVLGTAWTNGAYSNVGNQDRINMLFWKSSKFTLKRQDLVCSILRDIVAYTLQYKDTITVPHDTAQVTIIVAHPKAGSYQSDINGRALETEQVATYIHNHSPGNIIYMGDMNVYGSSEIDYQNVVNNATYGPVVYDPINMPGAWNSNSVFAAIQSQSTRTATLADSGATGGLDDRFDQMLTTNYILGDSAGVHFLTGTYHIVGQDGNHFNKALTDAPTNTVAPANVVNALYNMSDHLPVTAKFLFHAARPAPAAIATTTIGAPAPTVINPAQGHQLQIITNSWEGKSLTYAIRNVLGQTVANGTVKAVGSTITISLPETSSSKLLYLSIADAAGHIVAMPVLVK